MTRLFLLILVIFSGCTLTQSHSGSSRASDLQNPTQPQSEVTSWLAIKSVSDNSLHAYLREENFTFDTQGTQGRIYTVYDLRFNQKGTISRDGQVSRFRQDRRTRQWKSESLGRHSILEGVVLLMEWQPDNLNNFQLVTMDLSDVLAIQREFE